MSNKKTFVTKEGLARIKKELFELKNNKRKEISGRIQDAKELGDLSENAEYIEAKEEQSFVETRILELEQKLKNFEVIKPAKGAITSVQIGSTVLIKKPNGEIIPYNIVGSSEVDIINNRISNESPIGQALLGKKIGQEVQVSTPSGEQKFKIIEIK